MAAPSPLQYLRSLGAELNAQADRVRSLIGSRHWLTDGHHKEYLLIELIRRHIASRFIASRGFVVSPYDNSLISSEQDVLVVDTEHEAPLFNQGGVVVALPHTVRAAISVKSTLGYSEIADSIRGLATVADLLKQHGTPAPLWAGALFFSIGKDFVNKESNAVTTFANALRTQNALRCSMQFGVSSCDHVYRIRHAGSVEDQDTTVTLHNTPEVAAGVFLAALVDHLANAAGASESPFAAFVDAALGTTDIVSEETISASAL